MKLRQILLTSRAKRDGEAYRYCPTGKPDLKQILLAGFLRSLESSPDSIGPDSIGPAARERARKG